MKCSFDGGRLGFSVGLGSRRRSPEYPCVSRLRQRRLLSLLNRQELYDTFDSLVRESDAFMYPGHLTDLVKTGRWEDASRYISRFLPSDRLISLHGRALLHFLRVHKAIDDIVAGAPESHAVSAALRKCFSMEFVRSSAITKLRAMLWSLLCYRGCRDSLDLGRVRDKAASIIDDLTSQTPELKEQMTYARGPLKPHNVLPIGFGFRPRRHVKRRPIAASLLVSHYLRKRSMLPSSTSTHCEGLSSASLIKAKGWMVDLVDTSLKAGAPVGPVSQTNLGTFRNPAGHSDMSMDTDLDLKAREWAIYLIDDRLEAWPDLSQGYPPIHRSVDKDVAQVLLTIPDTLTRSAKSSTIPSFTKADAPSLLQVLHPLKRPATDYGIFPVTDAGVLPSQAMSATWPYPMISTVKNAGTLTSEAMSADWAYPSEYSLISIVKHTGALPSEAMSATWPSPSENSLISTVANPGTHKHLTREHCYTENACQGFSPRKNPRIELTIVGQDQSPKRQRTTLSSLVEGKAEDRVSACII
ncbi:uncharacterized protein [Lolium perenne]|uniref:uncharacterized protein isoform X3 n=1 Tax=Lolium perenne TaxID=4522 RepID=UPI0021F51DD1|nr:uncharacterized protein LOC127294437 isoform X3 [Lolium perenne]